MRVAVKCTSSSVETWEGRGTLSFPIPVRGFSSAYQAPQGDKCKAGPLSPSSLHRPGPYPPAPPREKGLWLGETLPAQRGGQLTV